ncbi:MAG: hypothetical protein JOZ18_18900 [Chloroflexi bacterium]|nr:hypothetical protein [Chloroflexota bacterium]
MAVFHIDTMDTHERDQIQKYSEFVNCIDIGGCLVTVRSIHHEPDCPYQPASQPGRVEAAGRLRKCSVMPNGVHVHLYSTDTKEHYMRFIDVSDTENKALFAAYYEQNE